MTVLRNIIEIDEDLCNGCGQCILACAEKALELVNGKARVVSDNLCDGLGACIGECPTGALKVTYKKVEAFDEKAVSQRLKDLSSSALTAFAAFAAQSCPGKHFQPIDSIHARTLRYWPIKLQLLSPSAPFLENANLLIAADCTAFSTTHFHENYVKEKILLITCPKFENTDILEKLATIFKTNSILSLSVISMEVPCCKALFRIVQQALSLAKQSITPVHTVLSIQGQALQKI